MSLSEFFMKVENTMQSRFQEASLVRHAGDRGGNREKILRDFLEKHLPHRYGVKKGEIITREGEHSHAADIIIYDAVNCPVLYEEDTAVLPIEGVYGIIEVKSRLPKSEFLGAARQIESFRRLAPRDLSVIATREYATVHRPSRPFGIVLGYELGSNSLESLMANWSELNQVIFDVNYWVNLVAVLGSGVMHHQRVDLTRGEKHLLLDTDEFVNLGLTKQKRKANNEPTEDILVRQISEDLGFQTFGRFFVYLLIMLERMKLSVPDLGRYLDPTLPIMVHRES